MKIVRRDLVPNGPGSVKMIPDDSDDLWFAYNLIAEGDTVMAVTFRKVLREAASGGRDAERIRLKLEIKVEDVDYDKGGSVLRIRGKNILENEYVKIGAFHTLELELKRAFVLRKDTWDSLALDVLKQASDPAASADLAVVLMQEGLAHIFLVGRSVTTSRARIETSIPRKHGPAIAGYESALKKFFANVLQAFMKHIDFSVVRCAVIASPGFTKDQFHRHLLLEAERKQLRPIIENKSRIILVHTTSGYRHSLGEVLDAPSVMNMVKDTKAAKEVQAFKDFFTMLSNDPARACYGSKHVEIAHERMAVQTLLITDELFRNSDIATRKKFVRLVESVKDSGGKAYVFSSMHVSGEQLAQLSGIAAILRFPLPDLEDIEMYVGHEEAGQLTEAVRKGPYTVVLFDEVEKAHVAVFNTLVQLLDDGRLTDDQGRTADFRNTVIIRTSNPGAEHLLLGLTGKVTIQVACDRIIQEVREHFRPELLNRLDEIVVFDPLAHDQLRKVASLQMEDVSVRLAERGTALAMTNAALDYILAESYDPVYGARPIRSWVEKRVVTQLSKMLMHEEIDENSTVYIDPVPSGSDLVYRVEKNGGLVNAANGQRSEVLIQIPNGPARIDAAQSVKKMKIEEVDGDDDDDDDDDEMN